VFTAGELDVLIIAAAGLQPPTRAPTWHTLLGLLLKRYLVRRMSHHLTAKQLLTDVHLPSGQAGRRDTLVRRSWHLDPRARRQAC
jgi:hypothetical protein